MLLEQALAAVYVAANRRTDGEGWSASEVARILGCSIDAAHRRIER